MLKHTPFIVIEGTDGSGKSTLCDWISEEFGFIKFKSIGGTFSIVKTHFDIDKVSIEERFSFLCGESIFNSFKVRENIKNGNKIIFDRYYYSTLVYCESLKPGVTEEFMYVFEKLPKPDLILFVKTEFNTMCNRLNNRGSLTLIEEEYSIEENYFKLIDNYMKYFDTEVSVIDNSESLESSKEQIKQVFEKFKIA